MYFVYILICSDHKSYIGCTKDLKDRIKRHSNCEIISTKNRIPIKLISYFAFSGKYTAYNFERYLKSGSGRAFLKKHKIFDCLLQNGR